MFWSLVSRYHVFLTVLTRFSFLFSVLLYLHTPQIFEMVLFKHTMFLFPYRFYYTFFMIVQLFFRSYEIYSTVRRCITNVFYFEENNH